MIGMIGRYQSDQFEKLDNFGFPRRRPQRRFSSWKKLLSLHQGPQNFLKAPLRGGVRRAARGALRTPLRSKKLGLLTRARAGAGGKFSASIAPHGGRTVAGLEFWKSFSQA